VDFTSEGILASKKALDGSLSNLRGEPRSSCLRTGCLYPDGIPLKFVKVHRKDRVRNLRRNKT